jgi:MFS family permease
MDSTWAWRLPSALQAVFAIISVLTLPFVPESPRWLAYQGRHEEALTVLAQTHSNGDASDPAVQLQYIQIMDAIKFEKALESPSIKTIVSKPSLRKRMLLILSIAAFSMLTASNIFSYYLGTVLDNAGITDSTIQLEINIILNAFCLVLAIAGTFLADRMGRKPLAAISTFLCVVFLFIIGALTKFYGTSSSQSAIYIYQCRHDVPRPGLIQFCVDSTVRDISSRDPELPDSEYRTVVVHGVGKHVWFDPSFCVSNRY